MMAEAASSKVVGIVIVAAGRGSRAADATDGPKQYALLDGDSVLHHTLSIFLKAECLPSGTVVQTVIHADDRSLFDLATKHLKSTKALLPPVIGGETRQASVRKGLLALKAHQPDLVMIHDAARPFLNENTIAELMKGLESNSAVLPVAPIFDTVKRLHDTKVLETMDRSALGLAQTPQGFDYKTIFELHERAAKSDHDFTDDVLIAEYFGVDVHAVAGDVSNYKLTTANDIHRARKSMQESKEANLMTPFPDVRVGTAYDVHASEPGKEITLCGLTLPSPVSLIGHSDADVALHALTDAVLGALADGDIGSHFPPSEERWRGAASDQFLIHAMDRAKARGAVVTMLDVTIICEAPKIGPHRDAMRKKIAEITGLELERVAVKATTNEKIGFVGREEGIAATASATLVFGSKLVGEKS
mgnify:CR=1 FL=1